MILMKTEHACGRCPNALMCMARKKLTHVTYCSRCGCVTFKHDNKRYLCTLLREGVHSRVQGDKAALSWGHMDRHSQRLVCIHAAVISHHAEYEGCIRIRARKAPGPFRRRKRKSKWHDCVEYFREINGFDVEL